MFNSIFENSKFNFFIKLSDKVSFHLVFNYHSSNPFQPIHKWDVIMIQVKIELRNKKPKTNIYTKSVVALTVVVETTKSVMAKNQVHEKPVQCGLFYE